MIYVLRNPRTHKEIKVSRVWMVKLYALNGYKLVNMYDPRQTVVDYSIRVLKEYRTKLQDKLFEIADGQYDKHPKENIKKLKTDITHKLKDIEFAIEVLGTYQD